LIDGGAINSGLVLISISFLSSSLEADQLRTGGVLEDEQTEKRIEWQSKEDERKEMEIRTNPELMAPPSIKKRTMEEMKGGISEEDMDEYRRKRTAANDPMAAFLGKDELVQ